MGKLKQSLQGLKTHSTKRSKRWDWEVTEVFQLDRLNPILDGISAASEAQSASNVDFAAIYELGRHYLKSWKHQNEKLWLKQWLPQSIPGTRVSSYHWSISPLGVVTIRGGY